MVDEFHLSAFENWLLASVISKGKLIKTPLDISRLYNDQLIQPMFMINIVVLTIFDCIAAAVACCFCAELQLMLSSHSFICCPCCCLIAEYGCCVRYCTSMLRVNSGLVLLHSSWR